MLLLIKTILFTGLLLIFIQDHRERKVYWLLFPMIGIAFALLHFFAAGSYQWMIHVTVNLLLILMILLLLVAYATFVLKKPFFETFGAGDLLMFIALAFSFASVTFLVLLSCSLLFSTVLYILIQKRGKSDTVPLAGNISLFFMGVLASSWTGLYDNLYLM